VNYCMRMNSTERTLRLAVGAFLIAATVQADITESKDNPWRVIIDRNPFGLQDPPPPPDPSSLTNQPPVKVDIKFTGISSDSNANTKRAWLMVPPGPGRPQPKYLSLSEGDSDGDLKVLEINETETTVKVLNAGVPVTLNFKEHGLTAPVAPVVHPGVPGAVPQPGVVPAPGIPPPGIRTAATPYVQPPSAVPGTPTQPTANPALRTIPARNLRTTPVEPQQQVDPAVQYLQMKAQELKAHKEGIPFPPIPPLPGAPSQ
ncbi:MAG TPA: hypothetical protein VJW76_05490, partial [Verrucomicrobiae bacterium]|nr:hypothetical protein [Verrucomicrobiae bacterium]